MSNDKQFLAVRNAIAAAFGIALKDNPKLDAATRMAIAAMEAKQSDSRSPNSDGSPKHAVRPMPAPAVERQAYDALQVERNRYRERVEVLEATLLNIAEPIKGKPLGNPWDFYNDVRKLAAEAVNVPYVHQEFPQPAAH